MADRVWITFAPEGKRAEVEAGKTILEAAKSLGVDITSLCGGVGRCGKCIVVLKGGRSQFCKPSDKDRKWLTTEEIKKGYRTACSTVIRDNLTVIVPEETRMGRQTLQIHGIQTEVDFEPLIKKFVAELPNSSLDDPRSDVDRLLETLKNQNKLGHVELDYTSLERVPHAIREGNWIVTVVLWNGEKVVCVEPGITTDDNYGIAIDIGTTKVAEYLVDLNTGRVVHVLAFMNPQIRWSEDVMSRITYAMSSPLALKSLQEAIVQKINDTLEEFLKQANVKRENIYEMAVVGNAAMHHLFLKLETRFLALSPFTPVVRGPVDVKASTLGLNINPNANVHILPVIAGFVGADCVGCILSTEMHKSDELCFMIDIGTNTEIVIGNKDDLVACSCASGPAFEGAHIRHGMRASKGAIERVKIDSETLKVHYKTIGDVKPVGICGSALVDIVAEMLKAGVINTEGTFDSSLVNPRIRRGEDKIYELVLAWSEETKIGKDIVIRQTDIRELQLAKAAMYTGATILMKKLGITSEDIKRVFIAGAFGNYIDPENALIIGMYPDVPLERIRFVGNAAGSGARLALVSKKTRQTAEIISKRVKYFEQAADPSFQDEFLKAVYLPHKELERFPHVKNYFMVK